MIADIGRRRRRELATQAWRRIELGRDPVEEIAAVIERAFEGVAPRPPTDQLPPAQRAVAKLLRDGPATPTMIAKRVGWTVGAAWQALRRLAAKRLVIREGYGRYRLSAAPAPILGPNERPHVVEAALATCIRDGSIDVRAMAAAGGISVCNAHAVLSRMQRRGRLIRLSRGIYGLPLQGAVA